MPSFGISGWTSRAASPKSLESRRVTAPPPVTPVTQSTVGPVNALAQTVATANQLQNNTATPNDPSLASRSPSSADLAGRRDVAAQASVYRTPNVPAFLTQAITDLNANQSLRRSAQAELVDRLFGEAMTGNLAAWDALRAASVQPGAHVNLSPITDPNVGLGYANAALASAGQLAAQTRAVQAAQAIPSQIAQLEAQRARLGNTGFGGYIGSQQQRLDQQLTDLYASQSGRSGVQMLGQAAARGGSGWMPQPPRF